MQARKRLRHYLPEWLKRLLRPVWKYVRSQTNSFFFRKEFKPLEGPLEERLESSFFVPPGHFFSPIVDTGELKKIGWPFASTVEGRKTAQIPGILIDSKAMSYLWQHLLPLIKTCPFSEKDNNSAYYLDNNAFVYADGLVLHAFLRHFKPKNIIEVGSGFSSACMLETSRKFLNDNIFFTFIEPYPTLLHERMKLCRTEHAAVIPRKIQSVELTLFNKLESGDILFIDSTHVVKTGSDVMYELFEVLPSLRPGVIIHFHDIFWPFEYPEEWIFEENRSWNELYAIRAFLTNNFEYEILFWGNYWAKNIITSQDKQEVPLFMKNIGGSLWLRKRSSCSSY